MLILLAAVALSAPDGPTTIAASTTLDPAKTYGAIVVTASNITIDGRGATLLGPGAGDPKMFRGVAIAAEGVSNVTLKNVRAKGWETALRVRDAERWTVEGCDFSDNFHDPDFGWGENGRRGGIVLERVSSSVLRKNRVSRVWDACVLVDSDNNAILGNDFSHTSNTGLKLWHARRNHVAGNDFSYGLRIKPGEVHARDSACVLIESGSDDNRFLRNDCTHGGDGLFVRVLNGWVSRGNVFEENDCSFANNNGFEAWAPGNVYLRNKANHCSYGFWLGASDQTVLISNEASHNGDPAGFHNSPHLPGGSHAGIVFLFGPSSHTVARDNLCVGNHGAGIALVGDEASQGAKYRAYHWILEGNTLADNRWGIFARHADWIDLAANTFRGNREAEFDRDATVTNVTIRPGGPPPSAALDGPSLAVEGRPITFDASASRPPAPGVPLSYRLDLGDGTLSADPRVEHAYRNPGFYRVGLTVTDGRSSDLSWRDLYVADDRPEIGTEGDPGRWRCDDPDSRVAFADDAEFAVSGRSSIRADVRPYGGGRVNLSWSAGDGPPPSILDRSSLAVWIKARNENLGGWQGPNPVVTLRGSGGRTLRLAAKGDLLAQPPHTEAREGWTRLVVPLRGGAGWDRSGDDVESVASITLGVDSWGTDPFTLWVDGLIVR